MSRSRKPRRKRSSFEAAVDDLKWAFKAIWNRHVEVAEPPTILYHYCPENVLPKILRSGKLWASDILCTNDSKEIAYAFNDVIAPLVGQRENGEPKYFIETVASPDLVRQIWGRVHAHIACLSSTSELPSQWGRYAKCAGYAIGFHRRALQDWCWSHDVPLFPVSYERALQRAMISRFLDKEKEIEISRNLPRPTIMEFREEGWAPFVSLAMSMKEQSWRSEQEWRVLIIEPNNPKRFTLQTREDGVRYFELPICSAGIVKEIVLGPQCTAHPMEVRSQLDDAGLGAVDARRCACHCEIAEIAERGPRDNPL